MATEEDWEPVETAPENTDILCWSSYRDDGQFFVDHFRWIERRTDELVSESRGQSGLRRKIYQEKIEREREWANHWGAEYWRSLPPPPKLPE